MRALLVSLPALAGIVAAPHAALAEGKYFDLHLGYNYVLDGDWDYVAGTESVAYDEQPAFGGAVGYMWDNGFRVEGELTYRVNDIDSVNGAPVDGKLNALSFMVNFYYELVFGDGGLYSDSSPLRPYIGIGGGGVRSSLTDVSDDLVTIAIDDFAYGLAWQAIGGLGVELTPTTIVTVDFRYIMADNLDMADTLGTAFEMDSAHSTIVVGLRTNF